MGSRSPMGKGTFEGTYAGPLYSVPTHKCIAHYSPAAGGECACPANAADECIHRREG